jgi:hypothetical protein
MSYRYSYVDLALPEARSEVIPDLRTHNLSSDPQFRSSQPQKLRHNPKLSNLSTDIIITDPYSAELSVRSGIEWEIPACDARSLSLNHFRSVELHSAHLTSRLTSTWTVTSSDAVTVRPPTSISETIIRSSQNEPIVHERELVHMDPVVLESPRNPPNPVPFLEPDIPSNSVDTLDAAIARVIERADCPDVLREILHNASSLRENLPIATDSPEDEEANAFEPLGRAQADTNITITDVIVISRKDSGASIAVTPEQSEASERAFPEVIPLTFPFVQSVPTNILDTATPEDQKLNPISPSIPNRNDAKLTIFAVAALVRFQRRVRSRYNQQKAKLMDDLGL